MTAAPARTAIVGAGLAGLIAGQQLARAGHEVCVFEKARGPGGRSSTRRSEHGGYDHGAQYFTVRTPRVAALVEDWETQGIVAAWGGPFHTLKRGALGPDPRPGTRRFVGTPRMSALARHLADGLDVASGTRIAGIERDERGWRLSSDDGAVHEAFERIVVATPAPQAVPLLAVHPEFARIANAAALAPCQAAMVAFAEPLALPFAGAFVEDSPLSWVADQASKPGREAHPRFVLHATAAWSDTHRDDPPDSVAAALTRAFAEAIAAPLPPIVHAAAHRWLYALPSNPLDRGFLWDDGAGLGVCGDWLQGARLEAALESGLALGDAMLGAPA